MEHSLDSGLYAAQLLRYNPRLLIDVTDIPLDEDLRMRQALGNMGFPAQSKVRIYTNGSTGVYRDVSDMVKRFKELRQNIAFIDVKNSAFVCLSEFYR
jgi:hypothetical protein